MTHTLAEQKALAIIPHITGALSFFGSCSILYDVLLRDRKRKLTRSYYKILVFLSVYDLISSFSLGLSTWPIPAGTPEIYGAVGNTQTCTAQGFFNQILLGSPMYNLMLAIYYLLLGRYRLTEEEIAKRYERYMHITANSLAVGLAVAGLPLTLYNSANLWCWIAPYPAGSEGFDGKHHEDIECERGHGSWLYRWLFFYAPLWFIIVAITVIMVLLTVTIRKEERQFIEMMQMRYHPKNTREETDESSVVPTEQSPMPPPPEAAHLERSKKMFYQASFYVAAFYITWWAPTLNRMIQMFAGESYFFFMVATVLLAPLQGFFNFLIYRHGPCIA